MANMRDLARSMAAGAPMGASAEGPGESGLESLLAENSEMSTPEPATDPVMDFQSGIEQAASAVEALPEEVRERARQHVEALRQIAEEAGAAASGAEAEAPLPEAAPEGPEAPAEPPVME